MAKIEEGATAQAPTKKVRRGISNETKATSQLRFHEKDAANNGLFVGQLKEALVDFRTISADSKGLTSFAGLSIPRFVLHFTSNHTNEVEQRHVYQTILPVESNIATIPNGTEAWRVDNVFRWIKHILDVFYLKGRQLSEAEESALELNFCDFDEQGEYVPTEPEVVLAGYKTLFENAVAMLNGTWADAEHEATGKPCYKDANGKGLHIWMKLIRAKKNKGEWKNVGTNGELAFDSFIGEGAIELQKTNMPPSVLRIDSAKESITPKVVNKQPTIGVPGAPMAGGITVPTGANFNPNAGAYADAGEDMPF